MDPPATTARDPPQLLRVDVHELAGPGHLEAAHGLAGHAVELIETVELRPDQHAMPGRGRHVDDPGDPCWPKPTMPAQTHDPAFPRRLGLIRRSTRPARATHQGCRARRRIRNEAGSNAFFVTELDVSSMCSPRTIFGLTAQCV